MIYAPSRMQEPPSALKGALFRPKFCTRRPPDDVEARAMQHSEAFLAVRNAMLELEDEDRRRLTGLFGSMTESKPDPTAALLGLLEAVYRLDRVDQRRFARWVQRYVNAWGQVPSASSFRASKAAQRRGEAR